MKQDLRILLVEDDLSFRQAVTQVLGVYNDVEGVGDLASARNALQKNTYEVVILDKKLPDGNGLSLIPEIKAENPKSVVIILTADSDFSDVKKCLAAGAADYVTKSANSIPDLLVRIPVAVARATTDRHLSSLEAQVKAAFRYELVGASPANAELRASIYALAGTTSNVLVTGENGTGKELVARMIHALGGEQERPFIPINCGAIPENLIESELFGYKRGAFTGAVSDTAGKFELADGGTLFLDEIGELPLPAQTKLLRVLEDGQFFRVGGNKPVRVSCRIIAATNQNLEDMVRRKTFRQDLYYRLNVVRLKTPPLRARLEDIPALSQAFLVQLGGAKLTVSDPAIKRLLQHEWPGNVRELRNTIERAIIACKGRKSSSIEAEDISIDAPLGDIEAIEQRINLKLPQDLSDLTEANYQAFMSLVESEYLKNALALTQNNVSALCGHLGIGRTTIYRKLGDLGLLRRPGLATRVGKEAEAEIAL